MKLEIAASTQHFLICTKNSPEKLGAVRGLLAVEPLPFVDDVEVGELAEVGVGLPAQPGRLAALEKADVVQANRQLQSALGRIRGEAGRNREGQIGGLYEGGPIGGSFGAARARKELRVRQGAHTWEGGRRGSCGKDSVWDPRTEGGGSGLYRVRGKVGGRQTREIGHRLARPLAGLPSPRDLHTMERPQTPFTSDSSLLYYYNCQVKPACLTFYFAGWCHTRSRRNTSKLAFAILTAQVES